MLQQVDVTRRLAKYVAATRWEDVPPKVRHQAKRSFLNLFAVALAGCRTQPIEICKRRCVASACVDEPFGSEGHRF